jgi:hypothetical protein
VEAISCCRGRTMASGGLTLSDTQTEPVEYVYHEKQVAAICAVHALNALVQV